MEVGQGGRGGGSKNRSQDRPKPPCPISSFFIDPFRPLIKPSLFLEITFFVLISPLFYKPFEPPLGPVHFPILHFLVLIF